MKMQRKVYITLEPVLFQRLEEFRAQFGLSRSKAAFFALAVGVRFLSAVFEGIEDKELRKELAQAPVVKQRAGEIVESLEQDFSHMEVG